MLYDEHLEYSTISKDEYEYNLKDISNGDAKLEKSIVIFCRNNITNKIKRFEINAEKNEFKSCNLSNWEVLVKYYIERIKQYDMYKFHCQEVGEAYYIHNLGYFYISDFYKNMKPKHNEKIYNLFNEYDKQYHSISFSFNDEEFIA